MGRVVSKKMFFMRDNKVSMMIILISSEILSISQKI